MKEILFIMMLHISASATAQKISNYKYKVVDTLTQYEKYEVIVYKNSAGKFVRDTIVYSKMTADIEISKVIFLNILSSTIKSEIKQIDTLIIHK